jgi:ABC-type nickel/cobalt efflux system permease component RcnA
MRSHRSRRDVHDPAPIPRWLRFVLASDRAGSAWYVGLGFFFAPALAVLSPWPTVTTVLWWAIALAGAWLGLLGLAMATGLAMVLRSGAEVSEDCWRSIFDYDDSSKITARQRD